ncbi:uncharacterized protein ACLA_070370 [Aspergillus clavatus NRRL 1]|uniref:Luciferase domain-containing protein n=1 Tax=Aspergillus clavatus (strain ATCC 1007 / CBS 513.65 / DSM 816 / NCTC 3887 / NRRL 1 / QM 1276 / 107) TaxID=344612 RepID=A1C6I4_ASPCL|nr:uncharacterized protein ACLA_070370 [Aspergillus clavatus NRRL 1]EAW14005.1 conserved hypothetical protein [Aspergillus clavatus NRRL 1]
MSLIARKVVLPALAVAGIALLTPAMYRDYRIFMSYGPGGIPYNILGWFASNVVLGPFGKEMLSTEIYDRHIQAGHRTSHLSSVPVKARERPVVGPHAVPQRQLTEFPNGSIKEKLIQEFVAFVARNPHLVRMANSGLELHADALFVAETLPEGPTLQETNGEIAHIHRLKDSSVHVTLAPADCKKVIESGWGQRHALSGVSVPRALTLGRKIALPAEYVLIYAPRTEEEVAFVMEVIGASVKYMTGSDGVN